MEIDVRLLAPIATSVAIVVSTILWLISRAKNLSYEIMRNESLIRVSGSAKRRIRVRFDKHDVDNVELVVVRLINSGHTAILPNDYQIPISIRVNSDAHILAADVVETNPGDLDDRFRTTEGTSQLLEQPEQSRLIVKPVLLNPGDSITLQLLVEDYSSVINIGGHITGVKKVDEVKQRNFLPALLTQLGAFVMAGAMMMLKPTSLFNLRVAEIMPFILLFLLGYVFLWTGIALPKREKIFQSGMDFSQELTQ